MPKKKSSTRRNNQRNLKTVSTSDLCDSQATPQVIKELCFRWRTFLEGIFAGADVEQDFERLSNTLREFAIRHGIKDYHAIDELYRFLDRTELNRSTGNREPNAKWRYEKWLADTLVVSGSHSRNQAPLKEKELRARAEAVVNQLEARVSMVGRQSDVSAGGKSGRRAEMIPKLSSRKEKLAKDAQRISKKRRVAVRKPARKPAHANDILIYLDMKGSTILSRSEGEKVINKMMKHLIKELKSYGISPKNYKWAEGDSLRITCTQGQAKRFLGYLKRGFEVSGSHFDIEKFRIFLDQGVFNIHGYDPSLSGIGKLLKKYQYIVIWKTRHLFGDKFLSKAFPNYRNSYLWTKERVSWGEGKSKSEMAKVCKTSEPVKPSKRKRGVAKKGKTNMRNIPLKVPALITSYFRILSGESGSFASSSEGPWGKPVHCKPIHRSWEDAQRSIQGARWVWIKEKPTDKEAKRGQVVWHSLSFDISQSQIKTASLTLCVDDFVNLYVNGKYLERFGGTWQPITVDIRPHLNIGVNNILMEIENSAQTNGTGLSNPSGIIYRLDVH